VASDRALDAWIQLYDATGNPLSSKIDSGGDDIREMLNFTQARGGTTYFVVCGSADWSSSGSGEYVLRIVTDPNDQITEATPLGQAIQTVSTSGQIDSPTDADLYAVTVEAGQRLSFDIDNTAGLDSLIRLFDRAGNQLATNDNARGPGPEEISNVNSYLEYTFGSSGTYYLGISGAGNATYNPVTGTGDSSGSVGSYTLVVSPGLAGAARVNGVATDYLVDIVRTDRKRIVPQQRTWVIIHGRNSSRSKPNISAVTEAIVATRPGEQVVTLDWSGAAAYPGWVGFGGEDAIENVGAWAAAALASRGFSGKDLNLVGHSWGSYVADELAERIPGGVNSITALDAAENAPGGYSPEDVGVIDFGRDSEFSWAFHSDGISGSNVTPPTADEAFIVTNSDHGNVVFLFADLLLNPQNPIGRLFSLANLLLGSLGPWVADQYVSQLSVENPVGGYEAVIVAGPSGTSAQAILYVTNAPILAVTSHISGALVPTSPVTLFGTATDAGRGGSGIASVTVNGFRAANGSAAQSGVANWSTQLNLSAGANLIEVIAFDGGSKPAVTTNRMTLHYAPTPEAALSVSMEEQSLTLAWSVGLTGYALQYADTLESASKWHSISVAPITVGTSNVVTLEGDQGRRFYRLLKP
jgi:pimeloyl-ACP methyl ester carboxylesterase